MTNPKISITTRLIFIKCYVLLLGVEKWTISEMSGSLQNMDPEAHAANKLNKAHHKRGSDSYRMEGMVEGKRGRGRQRLK